MIDIEKQVCLDINERQCSGIAKYGTTVAQNPLELRQWLQHQYEELLTLRCTAAALFRRLTMLERDIEKRVKEYARSKGWLAYKFTSPGHIGVP